MRLISQQINSKVPKRRRPPASNRGAGRRKCTGKRGRGKRVRVLDGAGEFEKEGEAGGREDGGDDGGRKGRGLGEDDSDSPGEVQGSPRRDVVNDEFKESETAESEAAESDDSDSDLTEADPEYLRAVSRSLNPSSQLSRGARLEARNKRTN